MDRLHGAAEAVRYIRSLLWKLSEASFDAAFRTHSADSRGHLRRCSCFGALASSSRETPSDALPGCSAGM